MSRPVGLGDSSDEDDEDLLYRPTFSCSQQSVDSFRGNVSSSPTASPFVAAAKAAAPPSAATAGTSTDPASKEEHTKTLLVKAQEMVKYATHSQVDGVSDLGLLRWRKEKSIYYPVCIRANKDEAIGLHNLKLTQKNDTLIRYLGLNSKDSGKMAAVPKSTLVPFDFTPPPETKKNHSETSDNDDDDNDEKNDNQGLRWSPALVDQLIKHLRSKNTGCSEVQALAERLFLDNLLEHVAQKSKEETTTTIRTEKRRRRQTLPPSVVLKRTADKATLANRNGTLSDSAPKPGDKKPTSPGPTTENPLKKKPELIAGAYIEYYKPQSVACRDNTDRAFVISCNPREEEGCITLDNFLSLPRDAKIKFLKRMQRGALRPCPPELCNTWIALSQFQISARNNKHVKNERMEMMGTAVTRDLEEMKKVTENFWSESNGKQYTTSDEESNDDEEEENKSKADDDYAGVAGKIIERINPKAAEETDLPLHKQGNHDPCVFSTCDTKCVDRDKKLQDSLANTSDKSEFSIPSSTDMLKNTSEDEIDKKQLACVEHSLSNRRKSSVSNKVSPSSKRRNMSVAGILEVSVGPHPVVVIDDPQREKELSATKKDSHESVRSQANTTSKKNEDAQRLANGAIWVPLAKKRKLSVKPQAAPFPTRPSQATIKGESEKKDIIFHPRIPRRKHFDLLLDDVKKKNRMDSETKQIRIKHLELAPKVLKSLIDIARIQGKTSERAFDALLEMVAADLGRSVESLWQFLDGNKNELLSTEKLKEMTAQWDKWLTNSLASKYLDSCGAPGTAEQGPALSTITENQGEEAYLIQDSVPVSRSGSGDGQTRPPIDIQAAKPAMKASETQVNALSTPKVEASTVEDAWVVSNSFLATTNLKRETQGYVGSLCVMQEESAGSEAFKSFEDMVKMLKEFRHCTGSNDVPDNDTSPLGRWASVIRKEYRTARLGQDDTYNLTPYQVKVLDELGFDWHN